MAGPRLELRGKPTRSSKSERFVLPDQHAKAGALSFVSEANWFENALNTKVRHSAPTDVVATKI